ncbi:MAG TPA: efflux RND transporter periplasmic adaptor subunit [Gemmatimonadaceae bacterium]|jgi:RND family efflux transporter MFP subunit|nr:efflux RND transporter periplasmic adaptor subunit [Gemmatimonadaceae bacterium]
MIASLRSAAFGIVGISLVACREPQQAPPTPQVTVAPAIGRDVAEATEFTGHFESTNAVDVRPRVGGFVDRVGFVEGAMVRQGDALFTIDPRPYEAEVARAEAALEQARTRKQLADSELERAQRLVSTQAISREELDSRVSGRAEGDAAIHAAEAALKLARLNLEWTVVRAPISGRVGRAEVTAGNVVQAGAPSPTVLTTIVALDPIYVYFDSDEQAYLKQMRLTGTPTTPVQIGLVNETGFPHEGKLDFVDNRVDQAAGTVRVRAVLANPGHQFAPGLFARVRLASSERHAATLIQDQAVGTDQDRKFVLVLKADSTVEYRPITLGPIVDGLRAVRTGLAPGEQVVINGLMRVRPGMKVVAKASSMIAGPTTVATATK